MQMEKGRASFKISMMFAEALPRVAMGSTSQNELLEIMDGVKEGNFNPHEALMLFKAWQQRNGERQSKSFKQRQVTIDRSRLEV